MHLASAADLIFADDRDVVLGLACNHARVATDAGVQVDDHSPGIIARRKFGRIVQCFLSRRHWFAQMSCWIALELRKRCRVKNVPARDTMMGLSKREPVLLSGFVELQNRRAEK